MSAEQSAVLYAYENVGLVTHFGPWAVSYIDWLADDRSAVLYGYEDVT